MRTDGTIANITDATAKQKARVLLTINTFTSDFEVSTYLVILS
jgi:hypothetical protein